MVVMGFEKRKKKYGRHESYKGTRGSRLKIKRVWVGLSRMGLVSMWTNKSVSPIWLKVPNTLSYTSVKRGAFLTHNLTLRAIVIQ